MIACQNNSDEMKCVISSMSSRERVKKSAITELYSGNHQINKKSEQALIIKLNRKFFFLSAE